MNHFPSIELLEATHRFPTRYVFKAIGQAEHAFESRAVAAVRDELRLDTDPPYRTRNSAGGRHVAVTFELVMSSAPQVLSVYQRLVKVPGLVVLF